MATESTPAPDYGFLPGRPPKEPDDRYVGGSRAACVEWEPDEELLLWPVLYSCRSEAAYGDACEALCEFLRRPTRPGRKQKLDRESVRNRRIELIRMRTKTRHMSEALRREPPLRGLLLLSREMYGFRRSGPVVNWGEQKMLTQWAEKVDYEGGDSPKKLRGEWGDLMVLLDRKTDDPDACDFLHGRGPYPVPARGASPLDPGRKAGTVALASAWFATRGKPVAERLAAWVALTAHLTCLPHPTV